MNKHHSVYNNILVVNVKTIKMEDQLDQQIEDKSTASNMNMVEEKPELEQGTTYAQSVQKTDSEASMQEQVHVEENVDVHDKATSKQAQSKFHYEIANIQASLIVSGKIVASFDETIKSVGEDGNIATVSDIPSAFAQLERWIGIVSRTHGSIGSWASWDFYTKKALESAAQEHKKYPSFLKKKHIIVKEYFDDKYINKKPIRKSKTNSNDNTKEQKTGKNNEFKGFATIKKALGFLKSKLDGNGLISNDVANILLRGRFNLNRPIVKTKPHKGRNNKQRQSHSFNQSQKPTAKQK